MAKLTALIRGNEVDSFISDWKPLVDFLHVYLYHHFSTIVCFAGISNVVLMQLLKNID